MILRPQSYAFAKSEQKSVAQICVFCAGNLILNVSRNVFSDKDFLHLTQTRNDFSDTGKGLNDKNREPERLTVLLLMMIPMCYAA